MLAYHTQLQRIAEKWATVFGLRYAKKQQLTSVMCFNETSHYCKANTFELIGFSAFFGLHKT